jgi:hypothetical protein
MFMARASWSVIRGSDGRNETSAEYGKLISARPNRAGGIEISEAINMALLSECETATT